jgi:hypothetical protein
LDFPPAVRAYCYLRGLCIKTPRTEARKLFNAEERALTSSAPLNAVGYARKALHIVTTKFLEGNEVFVRFSDGTAAIYEAEELEKLRPKAKHTVTDSHESDEQHVHAEA